VMKIRTDATTRTALAYRTCRAKRDGSRSDWSRYERKPGSVQNEGLTRVNDNVARIGGLSDPNDTVDADHAKSFAVTNIQHSVRFNFDLAIGVLVRHGYLPKNV
jgi:hypothetical protein